MSKVVVIGGGAAGVIAACKASVCRNSVILIEKNDKIGRKVMITGKGRCNVTNNADLDFLIKNTIRNGKFLYSAFSFFSSADTMELFESLNVPLKTERGNRVFPQSDKAASIVDAMKLYLRKNHVKVVHDTAIHILTDNGKVTGVQCKGNTYDCDVAVIATGGKSYPLTGSTGDGYKLAEECGHTVTELSPSLVAFTVKEKWVNYAEGLTLKNVTASLYEKGKKKTVYSDLGEVQFYKNGISGPLSLTASTHYDKNKSYTFVLDLKPALSFEKLENRLLREFSECPNDEICEVMRKLLPKQMVNAVLEAADIQIDIRINSITKLQRENIVRTLKGLSLNISGTAPIEEAIITRGGVKVSEINPKTMESKIISGLRFAGEIIDVDAKTGGFNLQIAFSTGALCGSTITED